MRRPQLEAASLTKNVALTMPVIVQRTTAVGKNHASVLFTVGSGASRPDMEEAAVSTALSRIYKNKVRLVEDTLQRVPEVAGVYRCFVALNRESVPYETASSEGWVNTAANMFADENDQVWEVSGEGDNRLLCRVSNDDLMSLLAERRSQSIATALSDVDSTPSITKHSAVMAFDAASEEMVFGIAVSPTKLYVPARNKLVAVESAAAVYVNPHDIDAPRFKDAPVETAASTQMILEYYKRLYGHNSEFYKRLEELIKQHVMF